MTPITKTLRAALSEAGPQQTYFPGFQVAQDTPRELFDRYLTSSQFIHEIGKSPSFDQYAGEVEFVNHRDVEQNPDLIRMMKEDAEQFFGEYYNDDTEPVPMKYGQSRVTYKKKPKKFVDQVAYDAKQAVNKARWDAERDAKKTKKVIGPTAGYAVAVLKDRTGKQISTGSQPDESKLKMAASRATAEALKTGFSGPCEIEVFEGTLSLATAFGSSPQDALMKLRGTLKGEGGR